MPKIGEHLHTARFNLGRLRIFVLVDHVLVDTGIHQPMDLGLFPSLAEGREILTRIPVEHQLVTDRGKDTPRIALAIGESRLRKARGEIARTVGLVVAVLSLVVSRIPVAANLANILLGHR